MKRIKITGPISLTILIIAAVIITSGCNGTTDRITVEQADYLLSSYYMLRGDDEIAESRAAWPAYTDSITLPTDSTPATGRKNNYPEKGQKTDVTIEKTLVTNVYKVSSVTTYPKKDSISSTTEVYFILDADEDGVYTSADYICDSAGTRNDNLRSTFQTEYDNGTIRYEEIIATTADGLSSNYAEFDINGELSFPTPDSDGNWAPADDGTGTATWSSMVSYIQEEESGFWIWTNYRLITGTRYYTEITSGSDITKTSVSYEKCIERDSSNQSTSDNIIVFLKRLFNDNTTDLDYAGATLSETVIRYEILPTGKKTVNSNTLVKDQDSSTIVTFTAAYEEEADGSITSAGTPVAAYPE